MIELSLGVLREIAVKLNNKLSHNYRLNKLNVITIETVIKEFEDEFDIILTKVNRKKIIFNGETKNRKSIIIAVPSSVVYARGNGWVDLTKIQIDLLKQYEVSIIIFNLSNGTRFYVNFKDIHYLLNEKNMMENNREGEHWKLDIWPNEIIVRNGGEALSVEKNDNEFIRCLL